MGVLIAPTTSTWTRDLYVGRFKKTLSLINAAGASTVTITRIDSNGVEQPIANNTLDSSTGARQVGPNVNLRATKSGAANVGLEIS